MRCISKSDTIRLGVNVVQSGVIYCVCMYFNRSVAYVSEQSFNEMIARGHAINEPLQVFETRSSSGKIKELVGGAMIFRCDFEVRDEAVWLIPEKDENRDSDDLLVLNREYRDGGAATTARLTGGAQLITSINGNFDEHFKLLKLSPGSRVQFYRSAGEEARTQTWHAFYPGRRPQYEARTYLRDGLFLAENGTLHYGPDINPRS